MKKILLAMMMCAPVATFAQKFGHVNAQEVMQLMPEYTTAKTELDALQKQYENDLKGMQDELQKKSDEYDKAKAATPATPETILKRKEAELQTLYQKIQQTYQDNQQELQKASAEKMQTITGKLVEAIKSVGQSGGYVYIMDVTGGIPYISTTLSTDVTADVKAKLGLK